MPVTWLHLSDLHLVPSHSSETYIRERTSNLNNLCSLVRENVEKGEWTPELIFVTGDIANRGNEAVFKMNGSEPAPATLFFDKLLDAAGLERDRLFIVPGNHEVNRNRMRGMGLKSTLDNAEELEEHFSLDEPSLYITRKLGAFAAWYNDYFTGIRTFTDRSTCLSEQVEIKGQRVTLLLMNSAVFCDDSTTDSGKLLIGQGCLESCIQKLSVPEKPELTIGLIHHPISFLASFEQTAIKASLKRHLDLLLRGHTHETEVNEGEFLEIAAGAAGQKCPWPRTALYGRIEDRKVTLFPIRNSETPHWKWTLDTTVFPEDGASGYCRTIPLDRFASGEPLKPTYEEEYNRYRQCLQRQLGYLRLFGLPRGFESVDVNLNDDSFVTLSISWQNDPARMPEGERELMQHKQDDLLKPAELMIRAFSEGDRRMLLVLGDAGAGKTTLMQYYALSVLDHKRAGKFGFDVPVRVFFLQLRALHRHDGVYESLPESLHRWAFEHGCQIDAPVFDTWLQSSPSLVILDGLDEIIGLEERRLACQWIDTQWRNETFGKARFVVTTRRTGYLDLEIQASCYKAFVNDFSDKQQREFLRKWYYSAHFRPVQSKAESENEDYRLHVQTAADSFSGKIIDHLSDERHKGMKPLAAIPMVLQMMALLWYREHDLPKTREQLYRGLFDYLVSKRDDSREILQSGSALSRMGPDRFRKILGTLALWMFSDENRGGEQVRRDDLHDLFRKGLKALRTKEFEPPSVEDLCTHLLNRAELLTVNDLQSSYAFRHKSIREYLAGSRLRAVNLRQESCFDPVISRFSDPSWEETIRFFISGLDSFQFDYFMSRLFDPSVKPSFSQREKLLLKLLIEESPERKTDALCIRLCTPKEPETGFDAERQMRQFMILDALASIGDRVPVESLQRFLLEGYAEFDDHQCLDRQKVESRAREVLVELGGAVCSDGSAKQDDGAGTVQIVREGKTTLFRNPFELMAEYLLIPGNGSDVRDTYFARYPVTNRLYRRFIDYLQSKNPEYNTLFPVSAFREVLQDIADNKTWDTGFAEYLKKGKNDLSGLFRSREDDNRKFGGDDQPVVSITWYDARSYCLWLSLVESKGEKSDIYRLPNEPEWEWAAAGKEKRVYPWGNAEPTPQLANYDKSNIGATTPVGSYPEGATPEGLYDMAGNVFEWQENLAGNTDFPGARALRGGSWVSGTDFLRCSSRYVSVPDLWYSNLGFRVLRPSLNPETLKI